MSLPTPVKTWQFNINQTIAAGSTVNNNKTILLNIKNALKGFVSNPWTILYSCNGTTAGSVGDGVDRWSIISDLVFAASGVAHSWCVLKQTGLLSNGQLIISASTEGLGAINTGNLIITLIFSPSSGFTGGSTTARPTATDEIILCQTGITGNGFGGTTPLATIRLHFMQSTDGACTRIIMCGGGVACAFIVMDKVANSVVGWTNPFIVGCGFTGTSAFPAPQSTQLSQWSALTINSSINNRSIKIGTTVGIATLTAEGNASSLNPVDVAYGNMPNEVDGLWPIYPIGVATPTTGIRGRQGSLIDLWWGASLVATGDTYDLTSKTFAQWGNFITPWDGSSIPAVT